MIRKSSVRNGLVLAAVAAGSLTAGIYYARASGGGTGIAYGGMLRNHGLVEAGTVAHGFTFDLVDGAGASLGCPTDTRSNLAVTNGRFDVPDLFSGCASLSSILTGHSSANVRIHVDGTLLSPDQSLGAVPYAVHAQVADSLAPSASGSSSLVGSIRYDVTWDWSQTLTGTSYTAFPSDTGNAPVVTGSASQPVSGIPGITFASLPAGTYRIEGVGWFMGWSAGQPTAFAVHDGTSMAGEENGLYVLVAGAGLSVIPQVVGTFTYATPQTDVTFSVRARTGDPNKLTRVGDSVTSTTFNVYKL